MHDVDLEALAAFTAVARLRSFRAAAAERGVTPPALSHTVSKLERRLGVRLLTRSTRAVAPTQAGETLLRAAAPALADIAAAVDALNALRDTPSGRIRITAPRIAAATVLGRALPGFCARMPAIALEISVNDAFEDLAVGGFDAGVRLGEALRPHMTAVPISQPVSMAVVGAPAYFARRPPPSHPEELRAHACIGQRLRTSGEVYAWEFAQAGRELTVDVSGGLVLDDPELMLALAAAGMGLVATLFDYAEPYLRDGRLVRVLEDWTPAEERFFLYYPSRSRMPAALRAFIEHLRLAAR